MSTLFTSSVAVPFTALLSALLTCTAYAGDIRVLSVTGDVVFAPAAAATSDIASVSISLAQPRPLVPGDLPAEACGIRVGKQGQAQIRFDDGAILTIPRNSQMDLCPVDTTRKSPRAIKLLAGGLNILPAKGYITVESLGYSLKTNGYLRLRQCTEGCKEKPGLYGKALSGEVIVEYSGGRSVLRNKPFHALPGGKRPIILARESELLAEDHQLEAAAQAKRNLAEEIKAGMEAFKNGEYEKAQAVLTAAHERAPTEHILSYYLGLLALEAKDNATALKHLQKYAKDDPEAARERNVNQLVTLLLTNALQEEAKLALQQEGALSNQPPEPNSIAVQPFTNRSDPIYTALAKGIAAMIIADLSKVPGLKVLEREKVQKLIDEIRLSESGLIDQNTLVKAGKLMRAEKVVIGSFGVQ